jgi:hypothetical protein
MRGIFEEEIGWFCVLGIASSSKAFREFAQGQPLDPNVQIFVVAAQPERDGKDMEAQVKRRMCGHYRIGIGEFIRDGDSGDDKLCET